MNDLNLNLIIVREFMIVHDDEEPKIIQQNIFGPKAKE